MKGAGASGGGHGVTSVQNAAARLLTGTRRVDHISPVLRQLHWLPVQRRVDFKLACFVFSSLSGQALSYLADDIHLVSEGPRRRLRSSTDKSCAVPSTDNTFGHRSFAVAGPRVWNSLPANLRDEDIHVPTRVSGVNLKSTGFLAVGAQCDILLNCAIQIALLN